MQEVRSLIDDLVTYQESYLDAPAYVPRLASYEKHCLIQDCDKCHERGWILEEKLPRH